jgi:hypothetical protein
VASGGAGVGSSSGVTSSGNLSEPSKPDQLPEVVIHEPFQTVAGDILDDIDSIIAYVLDPPCKPHSGYQCGVIVPWGSPAGEAEVTVFAGHGIETVLAGELTVPKAVAITLPGVAGVEIPDLLGLLLENGDWEAIATNSHYMELMEGTTTYLPGATGPNLLLLPPTGLKVLPSSVTVVSETTLLDLINEAERPCVWAACRSHFRGQ